MSVIVLNADNTYIGSITWQQSIILLYKGKAEIVSATDRIIRNVTRTVEFIVPNVVRLIKFVKSIYKASNVPYSKRAIFIRDKYVCQYCGCQMEKKDCTVDHVYPKALGGDTSWENCVTSCHTCNNLKGDIPYTNKSLIIKDINGKDHTLFLKKRPVRPSVKDFIRMKSLDMIIE